MVEAIKRFAGAVGIGCLLAGGASAQTLYGFDGNAGGATPIVREFTGPPGPNGYPNGPRVLAFPATGGPICPGLVAVPPAPPIDGDITVNAVTDEIYAADPMRIARYASNGAFLDSFLSPLPVAGMGLDASGPLLWITDGVVYGAVAVPPLYGCLGAPPPFASGPFPVPMGPGLFTAPITDIAYDPGNGSLWGCDLAGNVGNFLPGPVFVPGPFGFFGAAPGPCGLAPALTGIAVDNTLPGVGTVYVTDGVMVARILPGGAPAPPTFYSPVPCFPTPGPALSGLAFSSRPISFGVGGDSSGGSPPLIGSIAQSVVPNPGLSFTLSGSVTGASASLLLGTGALGPPLPILGVPLYVGGMLVPLGVTKVRYPGQAFVNVPLPAVATGSTLFVQWVIVTPTGSVQTSPGMAFTTAFP